MFYCVIENCMYISIDVFLSYGYIAIVIRKVLIKRKEITTYKENILRIIINYSKGK